MIYVDPHQLLMCAWGVTVVLAMLDGQRRRHERIANARAELAQREEFRHETLTRNLSAVHTLTCEAQGHRVEDVTSCGVVVARLCIDCDKQLDAPEWLAVVAN